MSETATLVAATLVAAPLGTTTLGATTLGATTLGATTLGATPLRHHFTVRLDADPNAFARLVEPFVIHDVLPDRLESVRGSQELVVRLEFTASADLARRLADRMEAMFPVHQVDAVVIADAAVA